MYTRAFTRCDEACAPECCVIFLGIEDTYTIGVHRVTIQTELFPHLPNEEDELKYHFGLWFTNYGKQIVEDNVLAFVNCCPEETCGGECDGPEHARFWYGTTQVPCSPGHFDVPGPPRTKKKGKKSKNKARVRMAEITMAFECDACASDKTITAAADSELAVAETPATDEQAFDPAMSRPTHPVAVPSDHTAPGAPSPIASPRADTPHPPRLPTRYRPQTCFCEVCLDPPARYARLDDSDQED